MNDISIQLNKQGHCDIMYWRVEYYDAGAKVWYNYAEFKNKMSAVHAANRCKHDGKSYRILQCQLSLNQIDEWHNNERQKN